MAWVSTMSESHNVSIVDVWGLGNGGPMAKAGCRRFGSKVHAMTVSASLSFIGSGSLRIRIVFSQPG